MKSNFKKNLALKILSVLIAVILWSYIQIVENPETEYTFRNVEVDLTNITALENRGLALSGENDFTVDITLKCQRWSLNELKSDGFMVYCDLSDIYDAGEVSLPVKIVVNNDKISVVKREPASITLNVEKIVTVEKPVSVILNGKVKEGCYINNQMVKLNPATVMVSGPESVIEKISTGVVNIDLSGKSENFVNNYSVVLVDSENNAVTSGNLTLLTEKIEASCEVYPKKVINITVDGLNPDLVYEIIPSAVEIAAKPEVLSTIDEAHVSNFVLASDAVDYKQDINLEFDENVIVVTNVKPQLVVKGFKEVNQ